MSDAGARTVEFCRSAEYAPNAGGAISRIDSTGRSSSHAILICPCPWPSGVPRLIHLVGKVGVGRRSCRLSVVAHDVPQRPRAEQQQDAAGGDEEWAQRLLDVSQVDVAEGNAGDRRTKQQQHHRLHVTLQQPPTNYARGDDCNDERGRRESADKAASKCSALQGDELEIDHGANDEGRPAAKSTGTA